MTAECNPGYYVEDKPFGTKLNQARAFARLKANEFGRPVEVIFQAEDGELRIVATYEKSGTVTVQTPQEKPYSPAFEGQGRTAGIAVNLRRSYA